MPLPFVIDNQQHRMADALNELLAASAGKPLDIATAYFAISGYRLVKGGLHQVGALRLLLGAEPYSGADIGLRPNADALKKRLQGDLEAEGKRHFWRYIDARTHEVRENRYEIAQLISCLPDEPRYIGDQDVFVLQDKVIEHILAADREAEAKAAAPTAVDPIQQTVSEEIKAAIRRRTVDREKAKACIGFLGQPMSRALHIKLKSAQEAWKESGDDTALVEDVILLAEQFGKYKATDGPVKRLSREDLELICFEYVSG